MATENQAGEAEQQENPTGGEPGQGQQGQQQDPTPGEGANGGQQQASEPVITKDTKIPDDHPLVKELAKANGKLSELAEARAQAAKATQLENELKDRPTKDAVETLQKRNDRLESFLSAVGGPISKALDSRTFTKDLFESDKDIDIIVKDWHKANPTATAAALAGTAAEPGKGKVDMNAALRAAAK